MVEAMAMFWAYLVLSAFLGSGLTRVGTYDGATWHTPVSFDHGYVLVWDDPLENALAGASTITLYSPEGHKLYARTLSGGPLSGAIDGDGTVAVVYFERGHPPSNRIALIDRNGKVAGFVDPGPYFPANLCFAKDGSLWTSGSQPPPVEDFMTVRRYSRGGQLSGAFLPFSEIAPSYDGLYRPPFGQLVGGWMIRTAKDRVGMVADGLPVRQWLELDFEGKLLGRWDFASLDLVVRAFTSSGAVYGQMPGNGRAPDLVVLDRATGKWNKTGATPNGILLAADGEDLVYSVRGVPGNLLVWVRMRAQWASAFSENTIH